MLKRIFSSEGWVSQFIKNRPTAFILGSIVVVFSLGYLAHWAVSGKKLANKASYETPTSQHQEHTGAASEAHGPTMLSTSLRQLTLSPESRALMNIETARVERHYITNVVRMVGKVEYDETRLKNITAWIPGRLDRLFVDFTGVDVEKGDHLVEIYSEELYAAQQELIEAVKSARQRPSSRLDMGGINLLESAREKLKLLGLKPEQIQQIEKQEKPQTHLTIYAPVSGTVIEKLRQEGGRVKLGDRIYTVADLNQVWVKMDAYESDLVWLRYGQEVTFSTEAYPGEKFTGRIAFIDPTLHETTRTAKVRVNVANKDRKLKPEMFVHAEVHTQVATGGRVIDPTLVGKWICKMHPEVVENEPGDCRVCGMKLVTTESMGYFAPTTANLGRPLVIPASAPLITGQRAIVYVEVPDTPQPTFQGREIVLGPRTGDFYIVRHGLQEGDLVVTSGNFKIDSAIQIEAKPSMMTPEGGGGGGMHQHGNEKPKREEQAGAAAMKIPVPFRKQLRQLDQAYQAIETSVQSGDFVRVRLAFQLFGESLGNIDADLLEGHPQMQWSELHMLLSNDVVLGKEVDENTEAQRVFQNLTEHMQRLRNQLLVSHVGHGNVGEKQEGGEHAHE